LANIDTRGIGDASAVVALPHLVAHPQVTGSPTTAGSVTMAAAGAPSTVSSDPIGVDRGPINDGPFIDSSGADRGPIDAGSFIDGSSSGALTADVRDGAPSQTAGVGDGNEASSIDGEAQDVEIISEEPPSPRSKVSLEDDDDSIENQEVRPDADVDDQGQVDPSGHPWWRHPYVALVTGFTVFAVMIWCMCRRIRQGYNWIQRRIRKVIAERSQAVPAPQA